MPRLPVVDGRSVIRALERAGFHVIRTKGSHHFLRRDGAAIRSVTVPVHRNRDLPPGTLRAVIDQAGLSVEAFIALL
jgi:predicted RNA binding protein YcfA (HicA-like mRNA interferase family)